MGGVRSICLVRVVRGNGAAVGLIYKCERDEFQVRRLGHCSNFRKITDKRNIFKIVFFNESGGEFVNRGILLRFFLVVLNTVFKYETLPIGILVSGRIEGGHNLVFIGKIYDLRPVCDKMHTQTAVAHAEVYAISVAHSVLGSEFGAFFLCKDIFLKVSGTSEDCNVQALYLRLVGHRLAAGHNDTGGLGIVDGEVKFHLPVPLSGFCLDFLQPVLGAGDKSGSEGRYCKKYAYVSFHYLYLILFVVS